MPRIIVPLPLRKYTDNKREIVIDGNSLREAMDCLGRTYPGFKPVNDGCSLVSIFVNSRLVRTEVDGWDDLSLGHDDEVSLIIPIAGG